MIKRGIITSQCEIIEIQNGFKTGRSPTLDEMRYFSLYWDKVVIPSNAMMYVGLPQEESFITAGIIERPRLSFGGSFSSDQVPKLILEGQHKIANRLMQEENSDWVIHQIAKDLVIPQQHSNIRETLRLDLAACLPVPTGEVNIHDILEFKESRRAEFNALHGYLDELYQQALMYPDKSLASKGAVSKLGQSIQNLDTVTKEKFRWVNKFDLSVELNIKGSDLMLGAGSAMFLDEKLGLSIPVAATIGGAIVSLIKLTSKATLTPQSADKNLKLAYLTNAKKEGIYK